MVIDNQIKEQYEVYNRSPEQIAENEGLDPTAIKAKLLQVSAKYRTDIGQDAEDGRDFSIQQLKDANQVIYENMLSATLPDGSIDYRTRQRAAEYIRDDKKGRKELRQLLQQNQFNILSFNEALSSARNKAELAKQAIEPKLIEV